MDFILLTDINRLYNEIPTGNYIVHQMEFIERIESLIILFQLSLLNELSCPLPANVDGSVMYLLILYPPIKHSQSGEHLSEQYYSAKSSPSCTHTNILKRRDNDKRTVLHEIPQLTCPTASSIVSFDEIESSL
ncbi:unnamed protein product [Rotaria sp. Silwood1]|nr:unnamed protein product [Rotaria sp. Silwood1]